MREIFFGSLRALWLGHLLATLAVAAAVAGGTFVKTAASSAERRVHELAHKLGRNMLVVPAGTDMSDFHTFRFGREGMPDSYPQKVRTSNLGRHIGSIQALLYGNTEASGVPLVVVGGRDHPRGKPARDWVPSDSVLLGGSLAGRLGLGAQAGLVLGTLRLVVKGVLHRPPEGLDMGVFTSLEVAQGILGRRGTINAMRLAGCWCSMDVAALAAKVERLLPGTRAITVAGVMKAQTGIVSAARRHEALIPVVAALLVGGMIALMAASQVRRQTREIGLLLAMGAQPRLVVWSIVGRAALVGAAGGVVGLFLGALLAGPMLSGMSGVSGEMSRPGLMQWIFVPAVTAAVGAVSAFIPARRAAAIDPASVLREV